MVLSTLQVKDEKAASRVFKKLREKAIKTFLDSFIISELQAKPMSGYDVITLIHDRFGFLVSSGTVYSQLYALERNGLVAAGWEDRKRLYSLTEKGLQTVHIVAENRQKIVYAVTEVFQNFRVKETA